MLFKNSKGGQHLPARLGVMLHTATHVARPSPVWQAEQNIRFYLNKSRGEEKRAKVKGEEEIAIDAASGVTSSHSVLIIGASCVVDLTGWTANIASDKRGQPKLSREHIISSQ